MWRTFAAWDILSRSARMGAERRKSVIERRTLTVAEVARLLGMSERWIYDLAALGRLPGVIRVGRRILFSRAAIEQLLGERIEIEPIRAGGEEGK